MSIVPNEMLGLACFVLDVDNEFGGLVLDGEGPDLRVLNLMSIDVVG